MHVFRRRLCCCCRECEAESSRFNQKLFFLFGAHIRWGFFAETRNIRMARCRCPDLNTFTHRHIQYKAKHTFLPAIHFAKIQQNMPHYLCLLTCMMILFSFFLASWRADGLTLVSYIAHFVNLWFDEWGRGSLEVENNNMMYQQQQSNSRYCVYKNINLYVFWMVLLLLPFEHIQQVIDVCVSISSYSQGQSKYILST